MYDYYDELIMYNNDTNNHNAWTLAGNDHNDNDNNNNDNNYNDTHNKFIINYQ